jgi:hypothetical protein
MFHINFDYSKVLPLLDVRLADFKFFTGREYLEVSKTECLDLLRTINRFQREVTVTKETLANPKTTNSEGSTLT